MAVEMVDYVSGADAEVVIGDRALLSPPASRGDIDLAEAWKALTGLPFVFAVWAVRPGLENMADVDMITQEAATLGVRAIPALAQAYAKDLGESPGFWQTYLQEAIHFTLTDADRKAMEQFQMMAAVHEVLAAQMED